MTFLFTDIVASTEHALRLGDARWEAVLTGYRATVRRELTRFGGHEVDTAGDGAARVMAAAQAGEVLLSAAAQESLSSPRLALVDAGRHVLKGLPSEYQLYRAA